MLKCKYSLTFSKFLKIFNPHFTRLFLNILGPKRFKKLRQACRKNFHLVAPLKNGVVTSYGQKCKKANEYRINEYLTLSVPPKHSLA